MNYRFKLHGLDDFKDRLDQVLAQVNANLPKAIEDGGDLIAGRMNEGAPTDTGNLRQGIKVGKAGTKAGVTSVEITVTSGHPDQPMLPVYIEYGTPHHAADPFTRTAFAKSKDEVRARIIEAVNRASE